MEIHRLVKEAILKHKKKIELTQWAVMSSVSSLVYSEYLSQIRQKQKPVSRIMVPAIRNVQELLLTDGPFMNLLSEHLIDAMITDPLFKRYSDAPELEMFTPDNVEIMKTIFDLYILENVNRRLPETIAHKFNLFDEKQQTFIEDRSLDLFQRQPITDEQFRYLAKETLLHLLILMPTMKMDHEYPESNMKIAMCDNEILTVENENALCPIHFDKEIIEEMPAVMKLLSFITDTSVTRCDWQEVSMAKGPDNNTVDYFVTSGVFNKVYLTVLHGPVPMEEQKDDEGEA